EDVATRLIAGDNVAGVTAQLKVAKDKLERVESELEKLAVRSADKTQIAAKLYEQGTASATVEQLERRLSEVKETSERWSKWSPTLAVLAALGCGSLCGFVNGALVSYLRVVPFIVTLGTMQLYLGLAKAVAHETTVRPELGTQVPRWLAKLLSVQKDALWLGLPSG